MKLYAIGVLSVLSAAGCGDNHAVPVDSGPCWPLPSTAGGQVELGTGDITFEPMPTAVTIIRNGTQSDPFLQIHSRIHGMPPGNPNDFFDPANPKTKIGLVIADLGLSLGISCPASIGYVASPVAGAFDMLHSLRIGFGPNALDQIDGKTAIVTIEVVGSNGLYAKDEKAVVLSAPPP